MQDRILKYSDECKVFLERDKPRQGCRGKQVEVVSQWGDWFHRLVKRIRGLRTDLHVRKAPGGSHGFGDSLCRCQASGL